MAVATELGGAPAPGPSAGPSLGVSGYPIPFIDVRTLPPLASKTINKTSNILTADLMMR